MPRTFVSDEDTASFLAPTFQFGRREEAAACAAERNYDTSDDAFKYFTSGNTTYQPRAFGELSTSLLTTDPAPRGGDRPQYLTTRRYDTAMPRGARNTCLLVEGSRKFFRYVHQTRKHPPSYYRFANGRFDCYAVWGRDAAHPLGNPLFTEAGCKVFVGRSARGALYGVAPRFRNDLTIEGYDTYLTLVDYCVLDSQPGKDSVVRYTTRVMRTHGHSTETIVKPELDPERFDPLWHSLAERAFAGFTESCRRLPEKLEKDLAYYVDQRQKADAESRCYGSSSYRSRIEKLNWQEALCSVQEAWQLEVVIRVFAARFDESPNYFDTTATRVSNMLSQHSCDNARREELGRMISEFVAPRDNLWDYSGD